jgi:hypothetical protein
MFFLSVVPPPFLLTNLAHEGEAPGQQALSCDREKGVWIARVRG